MTYTKDFISESVSILEQMDVKEIEDVANLLSKVKEKRGRLFFAGSGGGAGHSSHAAADFRKIASIESYSITDNVSELTARVNDESWSDSYVGWLKCSNFGKNDCLFIFSVGGGDADMKISENLVKAIDYSNSVGALVTGVVGRDGGHLRRNSLNSILIPTISKSNITTQVEGFQSLIWHLLVCHPKVASNIPKWESITS